MSSQAFDFQDLLQLVELMKSTSQFSEFKLRANGIELELRRGPAGAVSAAAPMAASALEAHPPPPPLLTAPQEARPKAEPRSFGPADTESRESVKAPMIGTVYLAPEPGAKRFVSVGQAVEPGTQLCIVEVMKLMNSIPAGRRGVVSDILVDDGEAVEFGQPLFIITPA